MTRNQNQRASKTRQSKVGTLTGMAGEHDAEFTAYGSKIRFRYQLSQGTFNSTNQNLPVMMLNSKILTLLFFTTISVSVFSQQQFEGNWKVKDVAQIQGQKFANALPKEISVQFTKDSLILESTSIGTGGTDVRIRQSFSLDGKTYSYISNISKRKITKTYALSSDNTKMTLTTVFHFPEKDTDVDFTRIETWAIENGHLVINKLSVETKNPNWETKAVFEKQH